MKSKQQSPCSKCIHQPVMSWSNACSTYMHKPVRCMHRPVTSQADACTYCMGSKVSSLSWIYLYLQLLCSCCFCILLRQVSINWLRQRESGKTVHSPQGRVPAEPEIPWRVSHPSIIQAKCCLTSVFEWEQVYTT